MESKLNRERDVLYVQTLGGFSVVWNGIQISGGVKGRESQMVYLLQLLLHNPDQGVSRNRLEEILFGEREVQDVHHALRSVLYNTRKKLREAGLPDVDYIQHKRGTYYWTKDLPVREDAKEFEDFCDLAKDTEEPGERLEYLLAACQSYSGEFLPQQVGVVWAAQEAKRYQTMFFSCVEEATVSLRDSKDWNRMKDLGIHAAQVNPFADWEVITMEAQVQMGQMKAARKLYDDTVDYYVREQGIRPSRRLLDTMGTHVPRRHAVLDSIQTELTEKKEEAWGGYLCSFPTFQGIYHMVERIMERGGQSVYLMLCTLVDSKGNPMEKDSMMDELSLRMEEAICSAVRRGDAVSRYSKGQYLVLLMNTTRENCNIVQKRINYKFLVGRQRTGIQYYVNSVACPPVI